jgi:hypothetical protein
MRIHSELRLLSRVSDAAIESTVVGKVLGGADYDVLLTGPTRVRKPDGRPLCVYLPKAMAEHRSGEVFDILHSLRTLTTVNRGKASGTKRVRGPSASRSATTKLASAVVGAVDPMGQTRYCRLTAWTGNNLPQWQRLQPMLGAIAGHLAKHVPDRYAAQAAAAASADPAWVVPGTPFSTITVNNSYATGVHTDKGDLDAGFSTITVFRKGVYTGGQLVFPAWRVAVDMADGDLILMDAHDWHGNVTLTCECGTAMSGPCGTCGAERISVVAYYRTKISDCGTPQAEHAKAVARHERPAP